MKFLSEEWLAALAAPDAVGVAGSFTGTVVAIVTGGADGEVRIRVTYEDGRPVTASADDGGDHVVALTLGHADARGVLDGEEDLNALFMSGRMKVAGDATAPLLDLLKASKHPDRVAARAALAASTD